MPLALMDTVLSLPADYPEMAWLAAVLLALASLASAAPSLNARQAITALTSAQIRVFKPYSFYSAAAYCSPSSTLAWNCGGQSRFPIQVRRLKLLQSIVLGRTRDFIPLLLAVMVPLFNSGLSGLTRRSVLLLCPIRERTPVRCKCCTLTAQIPSDVYLF